MIPFPDIDPIIFSVGPFHVRWYGLMYVLGFCACYFLVQYQIKKFQFKEFEPHFENVNFVLILSVVVGGRLGYVLFYNLDYYLQHPLQIFATWSGGMSFHGACLTLIVTGALFCYKYKIDFWKGADMYVAAIPIGLGLGRIGNFINGELFGRITDVSWGVVFPSGGPLPRHPSQLYEAFAEGLLLFLLLWLCKDKPWKQHKAWPHGSILALFLIGYGTIRMGIELVREPDPQIGYLLGIATMGQLLSFFMIAGGGFLWLYRVRRAGRGLMKGQA